MALFGSSNAAEVPLPLVMVGFISLCATIYYLVYGLLGAAGLYGLTVRRKRALTLYLSGLIGIVVALQSVGALGRRDIWVLLPLAALGYFYNAYAKSVRL
jgi:hypothetical protein